MSSTNTTRRSVAASAVLLIISVAGMSAAGSLGRGAGSVAHASPAPASISADSPVSEVLRFAEASGQRWRTLAAEGHTRSGAVERPFRVWVTHDGRSRAEDGNDTRVRRGPERLQADRGTGTARRFSLPPLTPGAERAMQARMAAHRANDPTLMREGEALVDTPLNDLISPARLVRKELGLTATSVKLAGTAAVAGREAVVLEARFPAELAKEDHWDVYVDMHTGVLLGLVIEPLAGEDRYETFVDSLTVDPVLPDSLFDCADDPKPAP